MKLKEMSDLAFSNSVFGYLILISTDFYDFVLLLSLVSVSIAKKHRSLKSVFDQILFLSVFGNVVKLSLSCLIEQFSFECRKVIGFALSTPRDWLKKFAPLFNLIRSTIKTNRDALACIFPRFASPTCNYFEF